MTNITYLNQRVRRMMNKLLNVSSTRQPAVLEHCKYLFQIMSNLWGNKHDGSVQRYDKRSTRS